MNYQQVINSIPAMTDKELMGLLDYCFAKMKRAYGAEWEMYDNITDVALREQKERKAAS